MNRSGLWDIHLPKVSNDSTIGVPGHARASVVTNLRMFSMRAKGKVWIAAIIGLIVVIVTLVGVKVGQIKAMMAAGQSFVPPPEAVTTAKVASATWQSRRAPWSTITTAGKCGRWRIDIWRSRKSRRSKRLSVTWEWQHFARRDQGHEAC